jgi:DNA invertase Pin-like site-specific DNA recombinase
MTTTRTACYARVSTNDQDPEVQLAALRAFAASRGWSVTEFADVGESGRKERRPQLDAMLRDVRRRRFDAVAVVKLDRLARSLHQLVALGREFQDLGVDLVVLDQSIDTTTTSGRLLFHVLSAIAEFEADLIRERTVAGLRRARARGKRIGRPRVHRVDADEARALMDGGLGLRATARRLGVHPTAVSRAVANRLQKQAPEPAPIAASSGA